MLTLIERLGGELRSGVRGKLIRFAADGRPCLGPAPCRGLSASVAEFTLLDPLLDSLPHLVGFGSVLGCEGAVEFCHRLPTDRRHLSLQVALLAGQRLDLGSVVGLHGRGKRLAVLLQLLPDGLRLSD